VTRVQARRSRRAGVLAVGMTLLVAGCTDGDASPTPDTDTGVSGGDVIASFAAAWPDPQPENFRGIVDEPSVAARDISAHVAELGITSTLVKPSGDLDCDSDSCKEYARVTMELAGVGGWSYDTLIKSRLNQGQWLVEWTPGTFHPDLTPVTTFKLDRRLPHRAPILDRDGVALTPESEIWRVGVTASQVRPRTYTTLSQLLQIDGDALRERVRAAEPDWFVPVIDLRTADYEPIRDTLLKVPGISIDTANRALAPTAEWGRAILGTVGPATADALKHAGPLTLPTDEVGISGLQLQYQEQLAGIPGGSIELVEKASDKTINTLPIHRAVPGDSLKTSLDLEVQNAAEAALARSTKTSAIVVVKASTGEVLAAANAPGPTSLNTAFVGRYAPGSSFKVVSSEALLAAKVVTPRTRVECPDATVVDGKRFKNYDRGIVGHRPTFAQAFAASCNTTFVNRADDISARQLADAGKLFGLGATWDLGLDAYSGSVPADKDLVTRAADMIGQGKILASPLAMAMVAAAVDSGVSRTPTLLPEEAPGKRLSELDPVRVRQLQQMMRLVVTEGTGTAVNLSGRPVYAKTGTAEVADGSKTSTNAWMIGYRGDLAFGVLVEGGSSGAHDAAPLVNSLLSSLPATAYQ
jgi:cell division protein FtsI/penicillin-binding protein 2